MCAAVAYAMEEVGLGPVLSGTFKFDPSRYAEWYGIDISKYPAVTLPFGLRAFGLWSRLLVWLPARKAVEKYSPSLVFIDEVAYKPLLRGRRFKLVEYIHFPFEVVIDPKYRGTGLAYGEDPYVTERYSKFPMNIYWGVYARLLPKVMRENPFHAADLVLTNSRWTADVAKMVYGERPEVLNPPIAPNVDVVERPKPFEERRPVVVMLGRFSQEKRYHWAVKEVAPRLVKEVPGAKLVIFGGAATRNQLGYVERVAKIAREAGLRAEVVQDNAGEVGNGDVYLRLNAPRAEINRVMDSARAFLHAAINEHWGIAVAEAMARGLPVVVHKSGGAWTDLAEEGHTGIGYQDAEEAVEALARLLTDGRQWTALSAKSVERARGLRLEIFIQRLTIFLRN